MVACLAFLAYRALHSGQARRTCRALELQLPHELLRTMSVIDAGSREVEQDHLLELLVGSASPLKLYEPLPEIHVLIGVQLRVQRSGQAEVKLFGLSEQAESVEMKLWARAEI